MESIGNNMQTNDPDMNREELEAVCAEMVKTRVTAWENANAFVTDKVCFLMRNVIKLARKNYWNIFDEELDPVTKQKKVFVPLTTFIVETIIKNADVDAKDINFRAKHPGAENYANIIRNQVRNYLDQMGIGEKLDVFERSLAIDGTAVWKTVEVDGKCITKQVDLLNCYIDPTALSIAETDIFIERSLYTMDDFNNFPHWLNRDRVHFFEGQHPTDPNLKPDSSKTKTLEVFELWGKMSKSCITGRKEDKDKIIDGRMIVSRSGSDWIVHEVESNPSGRKPYQEAWLVKVPGRWYGRGAPEMLIMLQTWINTVINLRLNRARIAQLGIFKVKTGKGITAQLISQMASNGVIPVQNMEDIENMPIEDIKASSYNDEAAILSWAQRVTSTYEPATGEKMPSSTATEASIQAQAVQSAFTLLKENIGFFLQRWIKDALYPVLSKQLTAGQLIRMTAEGEEMRTLDETIVNHMIYTRGKELNDMGYAFDPMQLELERQRLLAKLQTGGTDRYIKLLKDINPFDYDVQVFVTNEELDVGVVTKNLLSMLSVVPEYKEQIVKQVMDLMGLSPIRTNPQMMDMMQQMQMMQQGGMPMNPITGKAQMPQMEAQQMMQQANQPMM